MGIKNLIFIAIAITTIIVVGSCSNESDIKSLNSNVIEVPIINEVNFTRSEEVSNDGINKFGIRLFNNAAKVESAFVNDKKHHRGNVMLSPLSVSIALSILASTCDENTEHIISNLFGDPDIDNSNSVINKLIRYLPSYENGMDFKLANSVAYKHDLIPATEWSINLKKNFYSLAILLDFEQYSSVKTINEWCSDNTNGMIKNFISEIDKKALVLIYNAMYLAGEWNSPFSKGMSNAAKFHSRDNGDREIVMMNEYTRLAYYECNSFQSVAIPFKNKITKFFILLPNEDISASELAQKISYEEIYNVFSNMEEINVDLSIPKFDTSIYVDLTSIFKVLGLPEETYPHKMGLNTLAKIKVNQKTSIEINEEGAKSAAISNIIVTEGIANNSPDRPKEVTMKVNRPFLYFFVNENTGTILTAGVINNL